MKELLVFFTVLNKRPITSFNFAAKVAQNPIYSGTHRYLSKYGPENHIEYTWVEAGSSVDQFRKAIKPNTKVIVSNLTFDHSVRHKQEQTIFVPRLQPHCKIYGKILPRTLLTYARIRK